MSQDGDYYDTLRTNDGSPVECSVCSEVIDIYNYCASSVTKCDRHCECGGH